MTDAAATILIAEDNDELRALLSAILTRAGHRVLEAADGVRVVRLAAEEEVDALLLDVRLGVDDGIALGRELRVERPDLPIALMSGDSRVDDDLQSGADLTDLFLAKPFTFDEVTAAVDQLLDRR